VALLQTPQVTREHIFVTPLHESHLDPLV
jgi:hypothetical protein